MRFSPSQIKGAALVAAAILVIAVLRVIFAG
jgi:hypothetical protein